MNLYEKLIEVRKEVPYLQKSERSHQYNYVSSSQVLASIRKKMDELGLLLVPRVTHHEVRETTTAKGGKEYFTELDVEFTWINAEKPDETLVSSWYGQGVDSAEKGVGKGLTYAEKYFLLKSFNIATDQDDPDAFQEKHDLVDENKAHATEAQKNSIKTAIKRAGMSNDEYWTLMENAVGHRDMNTITKAQANEIIKAIASYKKGA